MRLSQSATKSGTSRSAIESRRSLPAARGSGPLDWLDRPVAPPPAGRVDWLRGATFAHRGLHGGPGAGPGRQALVENSPSAFRAAIERGLGIECDVQLTADGEAVVFHDFTLDRLTPGKGPVRGRRTAELATIALRGSRDTIPKLADVLALVAGQVPLLIEVKMRGRWRVAPLCAAVAQTLAAYPGACAVMSFDARVPHWFSVHAPSVARGLVYSDFERRTPFARMLRRLALRRARPDFLAPDIRDLPSRFASAQRARGRPLASWTVRSPDLLARARAHADAAIVEGAGVPHMPEAG